MINLDYVTIDRGELPLQPNGFLNIMANLTRTGVFVYFEKTPDGTIRVIRQLRHPDEVFAEKTLKTLMGLPTTNLHPKGPVSPKNARDLVVGMTSDKPKKIKLDGDPESYVQQQVTFFDSTAIQQIKDGDRRELSLGYTCELDEAPGDWNGVPYDFIQRNITYNHLSLVDRARGGAKCKVILDGEKEQHDICDGLSISETLEESEEMRTFILDGREFKVEDDTYSLLKGMVADSDEAKLKLDTKQVEMDKMQAKVDSLEAKAKEEKSDSVLAEEKENFDAAVAVKVDLLTKAKVILVDADLTGLTDRQVKDKVIKHCKPEIVIDGKAEAYLDAMFDIAVAEYKPATNEVTLGDALASNNSDGSGKTQTVDQARKASWERDQNLWKNKA